MLPPLTPSNFVPAASLAKAEDWKRSKPLLSRSSSSIDLQTRFMKRKATHRHRSLSSPAGHSSNVDWRKEAASTSSLSPFRPIVVFHKPAKPPVEVLDICGVAVATCPLPQPIFW
ncbi:unnamed protein product [Linum trigynum]|uniref:Uncharacterized protein n=1 Tax=Linum trigynum TaxID=586398 RepID=A0AAV2FB15_9ROSI